MKTKINKMTVGILGILFSVILSTITATAILAQTPTSSPVLDSTIKVTTTVTTTKIATGSPILNYTIGVREIKRRIDILKPLLMRITRIHRIPSSYLSLHLQSTQKEISDLTNLQNSLNNRSNLPTLTSTTKSLNDEYQSFAFIYPKTSLLIAAEGLLQNADDLSVLYNKIQYRIQHPQPGVHYSQKTENLLPDMQSNIADAKAQGQTIIDLVGPLNPDGYPANKSQLQTAYADLQKGRQDLQRAKQDVHGLAVVFLTLRGTSRIPLPSSAAKVINISWSNTDETATLNKGQIIEFQYQDDGVYDVIVQSQSGGDILSYTESAPQVTKLLAIGSGTTKVYVRLDPKCRKATPACGLPSKVITYTITVL